MAKPVLFVVLGPTASGKTSLAIKLAQNYNCEILSADSRQFYKELNIGVARPTPEELAQVNHHFIAHLSIHDSYSVGAYETDAISLLDQLFNKNPYQVLVGGSGLYIDAVCRGFDALPPANQEVRDELQDLYNTKGIEALQVKLQQLDPDHYAEMDIHNSQRLIRALEICITSGSPFSTLRANKSKNRAFDIMYIGINYERALLYDRINQRVHQMMADGLLDEVESLEEYRTLNALQTVGYKEIFQFMDGEHNLTRAVELIQQNTRRFAKRQLTWFRKNEEIFWLKPEQSKNSQVIQQVITERLSTIQKY